MQDRMIARAKELLADGTVDRVMGWKKGEFLYDATPAVFYSAEELDAGFVMNAFTAANVSKYLIEETKKEGKILAFLKPCDSFSFRQLMNEHRVDRDRVYIVGIPSWGKADMEKIRQKGITGITSIEEREGDFVVNTVLRETHTVKKYDVYLEKCKNCKSKEIVVYDELLDGENGAAVTNSRFDEVAKLEAMTPDERFAFWQNELSRCIRCNACRNVCPACTCEKCVFDNPKSGIENKAAATSFEENMFHIIRAFHVAGRCTDCGECSRVCPQHIPLHLLNRKFIKDMNELYGDFQAGETEQQRHPMTSYRTDDAEPGVIYTRGGTGK